MMPKAKATPSQKLTLYTEDLLSVTSKCIRKFYPPLRNQTVRLPIERGGEVVTHSKALITELGGREFVLGVLFPQGRGKPKLFREFSAAAKPRATGSLYWRLHCPRCGKETSYLYLVGQDVLCQTCGNLKSRAPNALSGKRTKQARMEALEQRIAELKESERRQIAASQSPIDEF